MLKTLENTKSAKPQKSGVEMNNNSKNDFNSRNEVSNNKISNNEVDNNKKKKNHHKPYKFKKMVKFFKLFYS